LNNPPFGKYAPTIQFANMADFRVNRLRELGRKSLYPFEYNSGNNTKWLTSEELLEMVESI